MPSKELGTKFTCFKCGAKFYDLRRPDPLCPKCGADQRQSPTLKAPAEARKGRPVASPPPKVLEPAEPEEALEEELETFAEDEPEVEAPEEEDF